jgi:hypothetical protein
MKGLYAGLVNGEHWGVEDDLARELDLAVDFLEIPNVTDRPALVIVRWFVADFAADEVSHLSLPSVHDPLGPFKMFLCQRYCLIALLSNHFHFKTLHLKLTKESF